MISAEAALGDYEKILKEDVGNEEKLVKVMRIVIKLLLAIRTNQVGGIKKEQK